MSLLSNFLLEELFEESSKTDFRDKFGEKTLQNFDKANQRLKNNGYSTDYGQYLKMSQEEVDNLILSLYDDKKDAQRKRMIKGEDKEIRGKYNYLGEKGGYKIYQPLDVQASMDLGVNTGWCTTGRYGHYGHPEFTPSEREAAKHFDRYTKDYKIKLYYFLNPDTMYGEYAIALYPRILNIKKEINGSYVSSINFELFTAEDKLDYSAMDKLPLDVIPDINIVSQKLDVVTGYPESLELLSIEEAEKLPESVRKYTSIYWLRSPSRNPLHAAHYAACVSYEGWILDFGAHVHRKPLAVRPVLKISNPKPSDLELYKKYYVNNDKFMGIYIGDNKFLYTGKVIKQRFNKEPDNYGEESNNYEISEIKQFVDKWLKRLQNKSKKMKESLNESVNANEPIIDFLKNINFGDEFDFEKVGDWEISAWITSPRHNFSDGFYIVQIDNDRLNKHYTIPDSQSKGEFESKKDRVIKRMIESLNKGNNKMTLNDYKRTRKKNLTEKLDLNMYDDCWVECCDEEPTFCYSTLRDCRDGIISSKRGDWYYGNGEVHDYTIKRWENGKLYDVDEKTNEVIYESLKKKSLKEDDLVPKVKKAVPSDKKERQVPLKDMCRKFYREVKWDLHEGSNADIPDNIVKAFEKAGGKGWINRKTPKYIEYKGEVHGYNISGTISLSSLDSDLERFAEDLTMAYNVSLGGKRQRIPDFIKSLNEGIDVESTGKNRMPLYKARSAVQKFNEDAKAYPYWVIKTSKWYDPEGLNIQDKDYNIEYAGTEQECKNKISQIISKANNNKYGDMVIEDYSDTFVKIYYPHAISKAVFSVIKNPHMNESLKEDFYWDEEDSFFTRDDLDEFQAELEYELPEVVFHKTYFEPGNSLEVDWDYEGWEETTKVKVDMRRIRYPRDLIRRYAPIVIGMIKDSCEKMERELNESYLKEDWDSLRDLAEEMINYLNDNDISWVDIYNINDDGPLSSITLEIDGDWKHDHLRANYLLNMKYGDRIKSIQDYSLEDTGSDWGKEAHVIRLK